MDDINMIPVQSSNVESIGYNEDSQILIVKFNSGTTYKYKNVPKIEYDTMLSGVSIGKYLNSNIKNNYPFEKIG